MALPVDGYISSALRTTGEFKVGLDDIVTDAARGNPEYTSTRTFEKGAKVKASNDIVFTSMIDGNVANTPQADDGSNWYASVFDNVMGDWADKTGLVSAGSGLYHNGVLWRVESDIASVTLSKPSENNASYSKSAGGAVFDFVVSQYAGGDASIVAYITAGLVLAAYDWFIDTNTLQVFAKDGATGTFSDPLDFDPATGIDSGVAGTLENKSSIPATAAEINAGITGKVVTDDELALSAYGFGVNQTTQLAELTDTGATFTDGTASYRSVGVTYTNNTGKPLEISVTAQGSNNNSSVILTLNGNVVLRNANDSEANGGIGSLTKIIDVGATYSLSAIPAILYWTEMR